MKRLVLSSMLVMLALLPTPAFARPIDADQTFNGITRGSFDSSEWQRVPGTRIGFVAPGRYGIVDMFIAGQLTGQFGTGAEVALFLDGVPAVSSEESIGVDGSATVVPGHHTLQLAVRGPFELNGPWSIHLVQFRG